MFPLNSKDPYIQENGIRSTLGAMIGSGGSDIPEYDSSDAGKVLGIDNSGNLEWTNSGNATIYHGNTLPNASLGNEGDIYLYMPDSMPVDFTLTITKALRGESEQAYAGAQEIQLFFTDGTTSKNITQFPDFHCESNGGSIIYAFDGDTAGQYWEKSGLPAIVNFGAKIPSGWNIEKLVVWQRNNAQYLDVWKDFTLAMGKVMILSEANLSQSDWNGIGLGTTFDDFSATALDLIAATYYKIKIDNVVQWIS